MEKNKLIYGDKLEVVNTRPKITLFLATPRIKTGLKGKIIYTPKYDSKDYKKSY